MKGLETLLTTLFNEEAIPFQVSKELVKVTVENQAATKKQYARANEAPHMNKKISMEVLKRSRLKNKFLNTGSQLDRKAYYKQRNYEFSLSKKKKKKQFYINP